MRWAITLLTILLLTGCEDQKLLERVGYILAVSFDAADKETSDNMYKIGFGIPKSEQDEQIFLSTLAHTKKEANLVLSRENNYELVHGQLRMALFGKDLAQKGLEQQLDMLGRDPNVRGKVKLLVVDGDAGDLLNMPVPQSNVTSLFLNSLMETAAKTKVIPVSDIFTFSRDMYDDGIDPVVPILKAYPNKIKITGIALFQNDRMVTELGVRDMPIFSLLSGIITGSDLMLQVQEEERDSQVGLFHLTGSRSIGVAAHHPIRSGNDVKVTFTLRLRGAITEYTGALNLDKTSNQIKLEALMKAALEQQAEEIIQLCQTNRVDPFGIGQHVRQKSGYKEWIDLNWHDLFSDAKIQVNIDVKLKNYGKKQNS